MIAKSSCELVSRCYELNNGILDREELKQVFITFVFGPYQEEVVALYGLDAFYEHLDALHLTKCRRDFDAAVEEWHLMQYGDQDENANYHDILFSLVKEAIIVYQSDTREALIKDTTRLLTSPTGFMARWRSVPNRTIPIYFKYLMKLGIRGYSDIESLVDMWLLEYPNVFDTEQRQNFFRTARRGRPNNVELALLFEMAYELKPDLSRQEKERVRKIYYYHRKSLTMREMMEKFRTYINAKSFSDDGQAGKNRKKKASKAG